MKKLFIISSLFLVLACSKQENIFLDNATYRVALQIQDNKEIPFILEMTNSNKGKIYNAEEVIELDEFTYRNDSIIIKVPVFEGYLAVKKNENGFKGNYFIESLDRIVPLKAEKNKDRFELKSTNNDKEKIEGTWETVFSKGIADNEYIARGVFKQNGDKITGTFETTTGDYRFLEGVLYGSRFQLSTFDGAHAFLFNGKIQGDSMKGFFYSGNHWKEPFEAVRNDDYKLPNANELTFLKNGYDEFNFSFPDENGNLVSLKDKRFQDKVTIVQIMGSWCPNCLDESKFYSAFSKKHSEVQFVALAFEIAKTPEKAFQRINRLREKIGITYPILLAQYGSSDKKLAQEKLPMLNHVLSYPTSIYIDKKGNVRKIHTGFNGPATGEKYTSFVKEFEDFVALLESE